MSRGVLAIAGMAVACCSVSAAELTTTLSGPNRTVINLNGTLAEGDATRFRGILQSSTAAGKPVSAVRLNSPGGDLVESVRLAALIQGAKIATVVVAGATCGGACFIAFIAGSQKIVSATATVTGPGAAEKSNPPPQGETPAIVRGDIRGGKSAIVKVVQHLGLLDAIISKMLATPEDKDFPLTLDDLRAMGATMTGKPQQPR